MKKIFGMILVLMLVFGSLVSATGDLHIEDLTGSVSVNPGSSATFEVTVANWITATTIPSVVITSTAFTESGLSVGNLPVFSGLVVGIPQTRKFVVNVGAVPAGSYTATLTATEKGVSANTDSKSYVVVVNPVTQMSVLDGDNKAYTSQNPISFSAESGEDVDVDDVNIKNIGSLPLNGFTFSYLVDNDEDIVVETDLSESALQALTLAPGATSGDLTLMFTVGDDLKIGSYEGWVKFTSDGAEVEIPYTVKIQPEDLVCSDGVQGDLEIEVKEPDNGEKIYPGDIISFEVVVDNNNDDDDLDVTVEAFLYDVDEDEEVASAESESKTIKDNDDQKFEFDLEVPKDIDIEDEFVIFVKVYEDEEDQCNEERIEITPKRKSHAVAIKDVNMNTLSATCGETIEAEIDVQNIGTSDEDNVYVRIQNLQLGLNVKTDEIDLKEYDDDDDSATLRVNFIVPEGANEGDYPLVIEAVFDDGDASDFYSESMVLTVDGCVVEPDYVPVTLNPVLGSVDAEAGETVSVAVEVTNDGETKETLKVGIEDYESWASASESEKLISLNAGQTRTVYFDLEVDEEAEEASNTVSVYVEDSNGELSASDFVEVNVAGGKTGLLDRFTGSSKTLFIIGDVVLVLVALIIIILIFAGRNKGPREEFPDEPRV